MQNPIPHTDYRDILRIIKTYFNVLPDKENEQTTIEEISKSVSFRGANLWVLIFAILLASLGLNVNSTAVIIGAMLVSPLMGPIIGIGLAVGIDDLDLLKRSFTNFLVTTVISVTTASLYFLITPITDAQSELLARTSPTLYDVLIALCGGAAGIVALATKGKGNVIPGVAIATALMPPLCTAGYGLATGQLTYFLGAFYLYFINTVFICVATFVGVRMMKFKHRSFATTESLMHVRRWIFALVILTLVPAGYMTVGIIHRSVFNNNVSSFMRNELSFKGTQIISNNVDQEHKTINIVAVGREITPEAAAVAERRLPNYNLEGYKLSLIQGTQGDSLLLEDADSKQLLATDTRTGRQLLEQAQQIRTLEQQLSDYKQYENLSVQLASEMGALYPNVRTVALAPASITSTDSLTSHSVVIAVVGVTDRSKVSNQQLSQLTTWLKRRVNTDNLRLFLRDYQQ